MEQIVIENIPISFTRKNIKNINVRIVEPNGEVRVSAPNYLSMSKIEKFIASRKNWILNAQAEVIQRSANKQNRMDKLFDISSTKDEKEIKALKKIYENELLERAKPIFQKWQNETGLAPEKIVVRWTKSVWGTCDKKQKRIMINGMLVTMDEKFLDYVVLHELTHLKYANHGEGFKSFMSHYMPNWKILRKELNAYA